MSLTKATYSMIDGAPANVEDFGAIGNGTADDTAAITAAIASLPTTGGKVVFPRVGPYACNIVITKNNVTLEGVTSAGGSNDAGGRVVGLTPFDPTLPVLQVGNDTGYVNGFQAINLNLWRGSSGQYGLRLHGGVTQAKFTNFRSNGFTKKCIWIQNGASYPIAYVFFSNYGAVGGASGTEEDTILVAGVTPQYTSAVYFNNGNIGVGGAGYTLRLTNTDLFVGNTWIQAANNQGVFLDSTNGTPRLIASNTFVDSNSSTNVLLTMNQPGSKMPQAFMRGSIRFDGYVVFSDATTLDIAGVSDWSYGPNTYSPVLAGAIYFAETTDLSTRTEYIEKVGSVLRMRSGGDIDVFPAGGALKPANTNAYSLGTNGRVWTNVWSNGMALTDGVATPSTVAGFATIYVDTADGDLKIKFGDGTIKTIVVDT